MNYIETNKLIAQFMGGVLLNVHNGSDNETGVLVDYVHKVNYPDNQRYHSLDHLPYNKSWDWLMPVVVKINLIDDYNYTVIIKSMDVDIFSDKDAKMIVSGNSPHDACDLILSVYDSVVEFIQWYNKNKQTKY